MCLLVPMACWQRHASAYRNPGDFVDGSVVVVGCGASGVDIARDAIGAGHETYIIGRRRCGLPCCRPARSFSLDGASCGRQVSATRD